MIQVVNKYKHTPTNLDVYCGRGSPLGNPFSWHPGVESKFRVSDRAEAIKKYAEYAEWALMNDVKFKAQFDFLVERTLKGDSINLVCFCAPKMCHGDIIKRRIEETLERIKELE